jgi:hypothetical protein
MPQACAGGRNTIGSSFCWKLLKGISHSGIDLIALALRNTASVCGWPKHHWQQLLLEAVKRVPQFSSVI